jgi:hypothetical protein
VLGIMQSCRDSHQAYPDLSTQRNWIVTFVVPENVSVGAKLDTTPVLGIFELFLSGLSVVPEAETTAVGMRSDG